MIKKYYLETKTINEVLEIIKQESKGIQIPYGHNNKILDQECQIDGP